jgi:hypothetical protein
MSEPGWLPDPSGRFEYRYFDGTQWTDQVSTGGAVGRAPQVEERSRQRRGWHVTIGTVAVTLTVTILGLAGVTACGSGTPSGTPTRSASANPSLDACIVGTWVSTRASGVAEIKGVFVPLSDDPIVSQGSGVSYSIHRDGSVVEDYTAAQSLYGKDSDGNGYNIDVTGTATGRLVASNGQATFTLDDPSALKVEITEDRADGVTLTTTEHPPASETDTYTCTAGSSLAIKSGPSSEFGFSITTTFAPR